MTRPKRMALRVDELEVRSLLSGISYTLTTDQSTYQVGQPIRMTFTETNTSDQPVTVSLQPTDFSVSEQSLLWHGPLWRSNPGNAGQPPTSVTLQPGQSVSQAATWDGTMPESFYPNAADPNQAVNQFGKFTITNPNAPQGVTATFQITDPLAGAFKTDQAIYQMGQPVHLIYTETNTSDQSITIRVSNPLYQIDHNGLPVLPIMDPVLPSIHTIAPGQTITDEYTYQPPSLSSSTLANLTGSFVAEVYNVPAEPGQFTADYQVVPVPFGAITSSITTDRAVYQAGQTVTMTFTETNVSGQAVTIPTGQTGFVFDQPSPTPSLDLANLPGPNPIPPASTTLQPGQSWTQTETWQVGNPAAGTYTLEISNAYDLNGKTATFQVVGGSSSGGTSTTGTETGGGGSDSTGQNAPLIVAPVTTNHAEYRLGESVRIRMRIPGTVATRTASAGFPNREWITVLRGNEVVSRISRRIPAAALRHLRAGRPVTLKARWNGRANQPGFHGSEPGTYTIDVAYGEYGGSTTIAFGRKHS